jgi:hypothetical protein
MAVRPDRFRRTRAFLRWFMAAQTLPVPAIAASTPSLAECCACGAPYVHPVEWEDRGEETWWIHLRCGACETHRELVVPDAEASAYDEALGRQVAAIERAVDALDRERMAGQLETFVAALEHDLIDASSFA